MAWDWAAGYSKSTSHDKVVEAVGHTIEKLTEGILYQVEDLGKLPIQSGAMACVSPEKNGWVGVWCATYWDIMQIFWQSNLSGIVLSGSDEAWDYSIWENGHITSWFVSSPKRHFMNIYEFFTPLLNEYVKSTYNDPRKEFSWDVIDSNENLFQDEDNLILQYVKPSVTIERIDNWKCIESAKIALEQTPDLLDIPYVGPQYYLFEMAWFVEASRGLEPPFDRDKDQKWINNVDSFTKLFFTSGENGIDYDALRDLWMSHL